MPTRNQSERRSATSFWNRQSWTGGIQTENGVLSVPIDVYPTITEKAWDNTPNYWQLRRTRAQLPDNAFSFMRTRTGSGVFEFKREDTVGATRTLRIMRRPYEVLCRIPDHGIDMTSFDLNNSLIQAARNSNFSIPVTLVEAGRTATMVADTARTLAGAIYDLRRGNLVNAVRRFQIEPSQSQVSRFNRRFGINPNTTAANYWLQYQYGWKPLLNDVKNAAEAVAEAVNRNDDRSTSRVRSSRTYSRAWSDSNYTLEANPLYKGAVSGYVRVSRRAVWRFKPTAADLPGLFGLTNPFEVVWEIIPFSFVADWFLPIGNYLSSLDAPLRFTHVGGTVGYRKLEVFTTTPSTGTYLDGTPNVPSQGGSGTIEKVTVTRNRMTSIPSPSLSEMRFDPKINATRATSAIALLWQQASRLGR